MKQLNQIHSKNPISLMRSTFYRERETKERLIRFLREAKRLSMGEKCAEFETKFAKFHNRNFAVLYNSGSSANLALIQSLINLDYLKKGQKVAFSGLTWSTNVMPLLQLGLIPIPVDIEVDTLNASSHTFKKCLGTHKDIKCLFISNMLGFCSDIDKIRDVCKANHIILIEDNCTSLGTVYKKTKLGNFGLAATFSFFVGHHLSSIEGGIVATDDSNLYKMLKIVRAHGWDRNLDRTDQKKMHRKYKVDDFHAKYTFYDLAYNTRPTEITAFLALEQLKYINKIVRIREKTFCTFQNAAASNPDIIPLKMNHLDRVSNFAFPMVFKNRNNFERYKQKFQKEKIEIRPITGGNITKQPFFKKYSKEKWNLKNCDHIHNFAFYCPNNPELTGGEIRKVVNILRKKT